MPASALVAGFAGAAFLLASCGAGTGNPSSVAHLGKSSQTTTTVASAASSIKGNLQQMYQATLSYSECMRAHGMPNFPNPEVVNSGNVHGISMPAPGNRNSPQYTSADNRCKHLLPNGGAGPTQAQLQSMLNRALKFSKCMRAHGVPNFPDPHETSQGISIGSPGAGYGKGSPQFDAAQNACQSYLGGP